MKKLLTLVMLGLFSAAIVGCEASAEVDDDNDGDGTYTKKTTVKSDDGEKTTKTEVKRTD
jgi:hypothetical protein